MIASSAVQFPTSSFRDCQEPKPSPWHIIRIIVLISLHDGCWPSNRSVEPHTYLAISVHIEHNPGKFPSAFCLPCIRILQTGHHYIAAAASALIGMHQVISQGIAHEDHLFFEVAGVLSRCEAAIIPTGMIFQSTGNHDGFPPDCFDRLNIKHYKTIGLSMILKSNWRCLFSDEHGLQHVENNRMSSVNSNNVHANHIDHV